MTLNKKEKPFKLNPKLIDEIDPKITINSDIDSPIYDDDPLYLTSDRKKNAVIDSKKNFEPINNNMEIDFSNSLPHKRKMNGSEIIKMKTLSNLPPMSKVY